VIRESEDLPEEEEEFLSKEVRMVSRGVSPGRGADFFYARTKHLERKEENEDSD
jgi:hypothetical protein